MQGSDGWLIIENLLKMDTEMKQEKRTISVISWLSFFYFTGLQSFIFNYYLKFFKKTF